MGWDAFITLYAIHHLIRPAKARTPASSASYHFFSLFMDTGIIPFLVFIAFFSRENWLKDPEKKDRWTSVFVDPNAKDTSATTLLLNVTYLAAAVMAGLHLFSAIFDIWLVVLFRRISNLPPDMNPLEDNLTSRKASKHKHKNSELTLVGSVGETKAGYLSGSTLSVDDRNRLSTTTKDVEGSRSIPFSHSRTGSEATFSPHNPETARWSRQRIEGQAVYMQSPSARASRAEVYGHSRPGSMTPSKTATWVEYDEIPPVPAMSLERLDSAQRMSYPASRSGTNLTSPARYSTPALPNAAPSNALVKSQQKQSLLHDNWFTVDDEGSDLGSPTRERTPAPPSAPAIQIQRHDSFEPQPLKMNPPTPPPPQQKQITYPTPLDSSHLQPTNRTALTVRNDNGNGDLNRHLTVISNATNTSSVYSESAPSLKSSSKPGTPTKSPKNTTPKGRYYGDLAAATRGVRGTPPAKYGARVQSNETCKSNGTVDAPTMDSTGFGALGSYGYGAPEPMPRQSPIVRKEVGSGQGRVVSRTGVDVVDFQNGGQGVRGRRDVSGKVAEEGRGGGSWMGWRRY